MPKTIISDTSCFIILTKIGELKILHKMYGEITTTMDIAIEYAEPLPHWVKIEFVLDKYKQQLLELQIDKGESSAIALALETPHCTLILDDYKARKIAHQLNLNYTGTIGVIIRVCPYSREFGSENITDAQIKDGLDILNKTFRKQRADTNQVVQAFKSIHADCDIEFRLATKAPNGQCHSGINRIASLLNNGGQHNVKALIHWPPQQYLNIYVVASIPNLAGHCVLPADADTIPAWDGIVIGHNYMGTIGTSSPLTSVVLAHECGHYLNLQHIWGGNNVFIDDINISVNAGINNLQQQLTEVDLFPNPSNGSAFVKFNNNISKTLSVTIYNVLGEKVASIKNDLYAAGLHQVQLPTSQLSSGLYYVQLSDGVTSMNKTLVVVNN